jgi:hypothetical protein
VRQALVVTRVQFARQSSMLFNLPFAIDKRETFEV